jgi:hypothetical protein
MKTHIKTGKIEATRTEYVDVDTGEVVDSDLNVKKFKYVTGKDQFFLVYAELLSVMIKQMSLPEVKILAWLLKNYNSGTPIGITRRLREIIAEETGLSHGTVANVLSSLCRKGDPVVLYRDSRGLYYINPRYAFKGSSSERNKAIVTIFELGCKDC